MAPLVAWVVVVASQSLPEPHHPPCGPSALALGKYPESEGAGPVTPGCCLPAPRGFACTSWVHCQMQCPQSGVGVASSPAALPAAGSPWSRASNPAQPSPHSFSCQMRQGEKNCSSWSILIRNTRVLCFRARVLESDRHVLNPSPTT